MLSDAGTHERRRPARGQNALLVSRNLNVLHGRTSVRLEPYLWESFEDAVAALGLGRHELARRIDAARPPGTGFTSALRMFLLGYFRHRASAPHASPENAAASSLLRLAEGTGGRRAAPPRNGGVGSA